MKLLSQHDQAVPLARHPDRTRSLRSRLLDICALLLVLGAALAACDSGTKRQPNAAIAVFHSAPSYGALLFRREERVEATLEYHSASTFVAESDQYDFNVDSQPANASAPVRQATFSQTLNPDTAYYFIMAESAGQIEPIIMTRPKFDATSSSAEVSLVDAAQSLASADVYLTAPGADLSAANPIGAVDFAGDIGPLTVSAGDYTLSLTAAGDPASVLFSSPTQTLAAGEPNVFVVNDGAGEGLAAYTVTRVGGAVTTFTDVNSQTGLRAIVAAADKAARDVILDDQTATPLFAALPFATVPDYATVTPGARKLTITPAGNPGVVELENTPSMLGGRLMTYFVGAGATALEGLAVTDDHRSVVGEAHLRIFNGAGQFDGLQFYVTTIGTDITTVAPTTTLSAPAVANVLTLPPGDYELTIRAPGPTVVAGPDTITVADGGTYSVLAVDGADAASADLVYFDDFN